MRHMNADLMGTTGLQTQTQTRMNAEMFHNAIVRHRRFTHRMHRHMSTFGRVTADRLINRTASGHMANSHGFIFAGDLTQLQ